MGLTILSVLWQSVSVNAQSRFAETNSRNQFVHRIALYDANKQVIDPADANSLPYSPAATCGKCHDYEAMTQGHHFNAMTKDAVHGRVGESWIWLDARTGTQLPLSYRGWPGTYRPDDVGLSALQFALKFGRHLPGGGPGVGEPSEPDAASEDDAETSDRRKVTGKLDIDCMICHSNNGSYNPKVRADQIAAENLAWAATAAMGLGQISGAVKRLPDGFDPESVTEGSTGPRLPTTVYDLSKFDAEKKVFFDVIRKPSNNACYYCHTVRSVGHDASPKWVHDEDVHIEAGLSCVDCHRNGIAHHTVRGFENENHPTSESVTTLSCRGCHMGDEDCDGEAAELGGRLGAPRPLHKGLPPLHLEKIACTACHSGPMPGNTALPIQTALAHELGLPAHRHDDDLPGIVASVFMCDDRGVLASYRMTWPAFWGALEGDKIVPLNPEDAYSKLRRVLRVRKDFRSELVKVRLSAEDKASVLGEERAKVAEAELSEEDKAKLKTLTDTKGVEAFREKLAGAFQALAEDGTETPVYVSGGRVYRLGADDKVETFGHPAAKGYAWPLAHDVRPARQSLGTGGCLQCHSMEAPIFYSTVVAQGPAPDTEPVTDVAHELQKRDPLLLNLWNQSFMGRAAFKVFAIICVGVVVLVLLAFLAIGINGLFRLRRRG